MSDYVFDPIQCGQAVLRAEYERESRALGWMKKSFLVTAPIVVIFLAAVIAAMVPSLEAEYGAEGVAQLVQYLPTFVAKVFPVVLYIGCVPSGYIWAVRYVRQNRVFVFGNIFYLALMFVIFVTVPPAISPVLLAAQWLRVSKLKSKLS